MDDETKKRADYILEHMDAKVYLVHWLTDLKEKRVMVVYAYNTVGALQTVISRYPLPGIRLRVDVVEISGKEAERSDLPVLFQKIILQSLK